MVFDAHDRAFALLKGTCGRGIYAMPRCHALTSCDRPDWDCPRSWPANVWKGI
jgi:hypothetical protein